MRDNLTELKCLLSKKLGNANVYFQPPTKLSYPCIVCEKSNYAIEYGNNIVYKKKTHYTVTLIGSSYNNEKIIDNLLTIPYCSYDRRFISDNLYHDVFDLYY